VMALRSPKGPMAGGGGANVWSALSDQRFQVVRTSFDVAEAVGPPGR